MDSFSLALLLYVAALVLAAVDLFVPSGGMLAVLAFLAAVGSVLFGFRSGNTMGMTMLTIVVASVPAFIMIAIRVWPHTPIGKRIILKTPGDTPTQREPENDPLQALVGQVMLTEQALLPTGQLRLGHRRFNAVSENGIIEAGERVKVLFVRDRNLVVRTTTEAVTVQATQPQSTTSANTQAAPAVADEGQQLLDLPAEELGFESLDG